MGVIGIVKLVLYGLALAGITGFTLVSLYKNNRLLFKCLLVVLIAHAAAGAGLFVASLIFKDTAREIRIKIAAFTQPPKEKEKPPEPAKPLDLPAGRPDGNPKVTQMPHGTRKPKPGGKQTIGNRRVMVSDFGPGGTVGVDPDAVGPMLGPGSSLDRADITNFSNSGTGGDYGDPNGKGHGDIPAGFENGKVGGRVYFMRMKHGTGAWNAYDDGTKRLLGFLNTYFPCEGESRAMAAGEIRNKYMTKGVQPSFLYLYCDDSFSLSATDVAVLQEYINKGGFLFLDSRPDSAVKVQISRELDKVLPGTRLAVISRTHPINTALFRLSSPGVGENYVDQKNYGVTRNGRLVVFYTPGNFSHMYSMFPSGSQDYVNAQYQMGANVMLYAIMKGNLSGLPKRAGANASVTKQALESLGLLGGDPGAGTKDPTESVKVKPLPPPGGKTDPEAPPETPDEIKLTP